MTRSKYKINTSNIQKETQHDKIKNNNNRNNI
jgi:hypothetical protein